MKRLFPIFLIIMMLSLTGCMEFTELTEEEGEKIAQGTAWIILNHNKLYGEKLSTPTPTPSPSPTPTWFPTPSPAPSITPSPTEAPAVTSGERPKPTKAPDKDENQYAFKELKDVLGIDSISLEFGGYEFHENYTYSSYSIEPTTAGNRLMVIKLVVKNDLNTAQQVNLAAKQLDFRLDYEVNKSIKPLTTMLINDFTTLNTTISAGERFETVILFEVEKDFEPAMLNLFIFKDKDAVIIKLK